MTKTALIRTSNAIFNTKIVDLDKSNRDWLGKLQVILLSAEKLVLAHFQSLFERSNRDAFWENESKIHERGRMKEFFS